MRIAILSRNKGLHSIRRLASEARRMGVQCDVINPLECQLIVSKQKREIWVGGAPLPHYDAILPRIGTSITDFGIAIVRQFELLGIPTLNSSTAIAESRNKLWSLQLLASRGMAIPPTVLARGTRGMRPILSEMGGLPVVLKLLRGTQGVGVMLVHTPASLQSVHETLRGLDQDVLIQRFVSESAGQDLRAFVVGSRVIAAMRRSAAEGEFRANIHRGAEGQSVTLTAAQSRLAIRAAKALGLQVAGVDLLESPRGPLVLEVNSSPGFEGIERATRINVARAIIAQMKLTARGRSRSGARKPKRRS